jgi:antitoxin ParD1/3/4
MNVTLSADAQKFVERKVRNGEYASADEAVNGLLAALQAQEDLTAEDLDALRADVDAGLAEADRGEFVAFTAEDVIAEKRAWRTPR